MTVKTVQLMDVRDIKLQFLSENMLLVFLYNFHLSHLIGGNGFLTFGSIQLKLNVWSLSAQCLKTVDSTAYAKSYESTSLSWCMFGDLIHHTADGTRLWHTVNSDSIWPCAGKQQNAKFVPILIATCLHIHSNRRSSLSCKKRGSFRAQI